jgi:hypothetical protein
MLAAAACLCLAAGCAKRQHRNSSSVTVELPPARPVDARPGLRLDGTPGNRIEDR